MTRLVESRRIRVYTASKLAKADLWKRLRFEWLEVEFTARWPMLHIGRVPNAEIFAKVFWEHDLEDIQACDVVLLFGEKSEKLRGGLVEAGMALALGKHVIVVGDSPDYSTWQYHPLVSRCKNLDEARVLLDCMALTTIP